jgi:deoxyribose-phosphate aldolase
LLIEGGVDFIKTATETQGPTTLHHVDVIAKTARGRAKIKAAGGIRTADMVNQMINL